MNSEESPREARLLFDTILKIETYCDGKSSVSGALLSSSEIICVLVTGVELNCSDQTILLKRSHFRQLPLNKLNFLTKTRFVEKVPFGVEPCKNVKKIYYESW